MFKLSPCLTRRTQRLAVIRFSFLLFVLIAVPANAQSTPTAHSFSASGQPEGVAVDGSGNVFVAGPGNNVVYQITAAGGYLTLNKLAQSTGNFNSPRGAQNSRMSILAEERRGN